MQIDSHINGFDNFECVQVDDGYRAVIIRYAIPAGVGYIEFVAHNHHFFRLVTDHTGILDSQCGSVNTCYIPQSGVGIYFDRADRIFDVLNQLDLYPKEAVNGTELLFVNFGDKEAAYCLPILTKVREAGVRAEIYPDASKMKKQMGYANDKQIPFVAIVGENEMNEGKLTLKNMTTGEQSLVTPDELLAVVKA